MRLITNWEGLSKKVWHRGDDSWGIDYLPEVSNVSFADAAGMLRNALYLVLNSRKYDCAIVCGKICVFISIFSLLFFWRKKIPLICAECLWYREKNSVKRIWQFLKFKLWDVCVDKYVVWAERECEDYARVLRLKKEKFVFVPFFHTLHNYEYVVTDDGFIFSGGNYDRDYDTLFDAVRGLRYKVIVATNLERNYRGKDIPENVHIVSLTHEEFRQYMARCKVNVIMMEGGHLHSGGQQTMINGMLMGKPTIITDYAGATCYIENNSDAIAIEPGDVRALREAIVKLCEDKAFYTEMSKKGKCTAEKYTPKYTVDCILGVVRSLIG